MLPHKVKVMEEYPPQSYLGYNSQNYIPIANFIMVEEVKASHKSKSINFALKTRSKCIAIGSVCLHMCKTQNFALDFDHISLQGGLYL